ncbi:MAG: metal-dependent hydrolase [Trueperaceae bacterium]|nr:metal-dependent hydrolase [Trueperaceae bacterium]
MQTYSHFIITAALLKPIRRWSEQRRLPPLRLSALLWGSVLPDLPLIALTLICGLIDLRSGLEFGSEAFFETSTMAKLFEVWFFHNPWVITLQNLFHSPLLLLSYIGLSYGLWRHGKKPMGWGFWLTCSALLHSLIDILVHHNDGPLLLFPLNWSLRFHSPISYWDPAYYGIPFAIFEHSLDLILLALFVIAGLLKGRNQRRARLRS